MQLQACEEQITFARAFPCPLDLAARLAHMHARPRTRGSDPPRGADPHSTSRSSSGRIGGRLPLTMRSATRWELSSTGNEISPKARRMGSHVDCDGVSTGCASFRSCALREVQEAVKAAAFRGLPSVGAPREHFPDMMAERRTDLAGIGHQMHEAGADNRLQHQEQHGS